MVVTDLEQAVRHYSDILGIEFTEPAVLTFRGWKTRSRIRLR